MRRKLGRHQEETLEEVSDQARGQVKDQRSEQGQAKGQRSEQVTRVDFERVQKSEPRMVAIQMLYYSDGSDNEEEEYI